MNHRIWIVALCATASVACGGSMPMAAPTAPSPSVLAVSIQSTVQGLGNAGAYGPGISLSIWAGAPMLASARLEVGFADGSAPVDVPFEPASVRIGPDARGLFSASVPEASDPRLGGRKPTSFRAAVTVRDEAGAEKTLFVALNVSQR